MVLTRREYSRYRPWWGGSSTKPGHFFLACQMAVSYTHLLLTAAAGPVSNLLLAAALGLLGRWWEPMYLFAGAQLVLGVFNLLPALPLDGGRILWLALAWLTEPYTAQRVLSAVSLAVSLALLLGGGGLI